MREFSFVLTKNLLALTEKWFFSVYTAFVVKLWVSKEVKPVKFCPLSLLYIVRLFRFTIFVVFVTRKEESNHWGYKSRALICTDSCFVDGFDLFCFFLDGPGRTWTILWTAHLLSKSQSKSDQGMATRTDGSAQWRQCGRHHKLCGSVLRKTEAPVGMHFFGKNNFRAPVSRQVKTLKVLNETVRWVDLSLLLSRLLAVRLFS